MLPFISSADSMMLHIVVLVIIILFIMLAMFNVLARIATALEIIASIHVKGVEALGVHMLPVREEDIHKVSK